jgi:hypothetical protein
MNFFQLSGYLLLLLLLEAITDVSNDRYKQTGKKLFGFIQHSAQLAMLMGFYAFGKLTADYSILQSLYTVTGYLLFRIAGFNLMVNGMKKQDALFVGTSNFYDVYILTFISNITGDYFNLVYSTIMGLALFFACYMINMVKYL